MRTALILGTALLALALAPSAAMAQLRVEVALGDMLVVSDDPANLGDPATSRDDVTLSADPTTITVTQSAPGRTLAPGSGCSGGPTVVTCARTGIARASVSLLRGDDDLDASAFDLPTTVDGGEGADGLITGIGDDHVIGGPGADVLSAGAGDDHVSATEWLAGDPGDQAISCGPGDDDLDDDLADPAPAGDDCEVVAPELTGTPTLSPEPHAVGTTLSVTTPFVASGDTTVDVEWWRCRRGSPCELRAQGPQYVISAADTGWSFYADVLVFNRAGGVTAKSHFTHAIGSLVARPRPGTAPPAAVPPPPVAPVATTPSLTQQRAALAAAIGPLARDVGRLNLRRLRASIAHRITPPFAGRLLLRWYVTRAEARRHGVRSRAARVLVAQGSGIASAGRPLVVQVRPTAMGRRMLRRARVMRIALRAGLHGVSAERQVTLRRR